MELRSGLCAVRPHPARALDDHGTDGEAELTENRRQDEAESGVASAEAKRLRDLLRLPRFCPDNHLADTTKAKKSPAHGGYERGANRARNRGAGAHGSCCRSASAGPMWRKSHSERWGDAWLR